MATTVNYKTVTIGKEFRVLNANKATQSSEFLAAITKAANDATSNQKLLESSVEQLATRSRTILHSQEKLVTTLSRQSKEKKIPADVLTGVRSAMSAIEALAQQAEESRTGCSRAVEDLLREKWKEQIPEGIAMNGVVKAKDNIARALKSASESIQRIRNDSAAMNELVRQVKGILSDTDKAAKAESEANEVARQIVDLCERLAKDLDQWFRSGVGIKDSASAAAANAASAAETATSSTKSIAKKSKSSDSGIARQTEKDLERAKKELARAEIDIKQLQKELIELETDFEKYEKMQALLVKTLTINYPKFIQASRESEASVQSVKRKFVFVRKFEADCEKAVSLLSTAVKSLHKAVDGLTRALKGK